MINFKTVEEKSRLFSVLGDPTRLKILNVLIEDPNICVSELANKLEVSTSAVSQQCKLLEMSGLLRRVREGQRICYKLTNDDSKVQSLLYLVNN